MQEKSITDDARAEGMATLLELGVTPASGRAESSDDQAAWELESLLAAGAPGEAGSAGVSVAEALLDAGTSLDVCRGSSGSTRS